MSGSNDIDVIRLRGRKQTTIEDLLGFEPRNEDSYLLSSQTDAVGGLVLGATGNVRIADLNNLFAKMKAEGVMQGG